MAETLIFDFKPIIDLSECLSDSPKFRLVLDRNETDLIEFESKIDKIVKLCAVMVEIGKSFIKAKSNFINGIWDLLVYFKDDQTLIQSLNRFVQTLTELLKYDTILIDQANRAVGKNLSHFMREDIFKVKETKRHFDKISDDYDSVLSRHSQTPKTKPNECEEASNLLTATRSCFQHMSLDYVTQLSVLKSKKRHEVLDSLLSLMHAYGTYYHQGSDLFQDFDQFKKDTANTIIDMRNSTNVLEKQLESRHTLVSAKEPIPKLMKTDRVIRLEGYLFKRTSNAFKTWNRRWFIIQDHQLVYQKRSHERELTVMEEDLRLCTAKPVQFMERRFCFEVLSPSKSHILQADSEEACQQWISAMQAGIDAAFNSNDRSIEVQSVDSSDSWCTASSNSTNNSRNSRSSNSINNLPTGASGNGSVVPPAKPPRAATYTQICSIPGNELCCDCGAVDPKWSSINLGITLCIECSGIHRSLGVHLSKVRSLNLDAWDLELIKVMSSLGNSLINSIFEWKVDESVARRATPDCDRTQRELWIKAKYVKKAFVDRSSKTTEQIAIDLPIGGDLSEQNIEQMNTESHNSCDKNSIEFNNSEQTIDALDGAIDTTDGSTQLVIDKTFNEFSKNSIESDSEDEDSEETQLMISKPNTDQKNESSKISQKDQKESVVLRHNNNNINNSSESGLNSDLNLNSDNKYFNLLLYNAAINCDLKTMCEGLAKGAAINWQNPDDQNRTALHEAIRSDAVTVCEYLLLNGAKCNVADDNGVTPLHLATQRGNTGQVCLLLKRGADQSAVTKEGCNALSIAINNANADIVTLLRLAKLNEEMKNDEEFGNINDETFNAVVRDFSQLASNSPEKLRRNTQIN